MSKMKRLASLLLALALVLALGVSAFADGEEDGTDTEEETTYTITISSATSGHVYTAYQIFSGTLSEDGKTLSDVEWGDDVNGTNLLAALKADSTLGSLFASCTTAADVAEVLASDRWTADYTVIFADIADSYVSGGKTGTYSEGSYKIEGLSAGYYLVIDTLAEDSTMADGDAYSRNMIQLVTNVTVANKAVYPTVDKTVSDKDASIGDTVTYTLTGTVPDTTGYDSYTYIFHDTLSSGLTYSNSVKVTATVTTTTTGVDDDGNEITSTKTSTVTIPATATVTTDDGSETVTNYTVVVSGYTEVSDTSDTTVTYYTYSNETDAYEVASDTSDSDTTYYTANTTDGCTVEIIFSDITSLYDEDGNLIDVSTISKITVTYTATLNENAVIGTDGNTNEVYVEYSNNPNGSGTGTTETDEVVTFTFELDVTKVDGDSYDEDTKTYTDVLSGAEFVLYYTVTTTDETTNTKTTTKYYLIATEATEEQEVEGDDGSAKTITVGTGTYTVTGWTTDKTKATTLTSASDGTFEIIGLDTGTYYLEETKAPDGYNLLANAITIVISATYKDTDNDGLDEVEALTATADSKSLTTDSSSGTVSATVENNAGSTLPSTGGIGTTIFYVIGSIMVLGAVVLLITHKRMSKAE